MGKFLVLAMVALVIALGLPTPVMPNHTPVKAVLLDGMVDSDMLDKVRATLDEARQTHARKVRFNMLSPGGPVFPALEIARIVRDAYDKDGIVIEIHASTLCASGCTIILAAGSPGHRFIHKQTLFLVHAVQGGFGGCMDWPKEPKTQDEYALAAVYAMLRDSYVRSTGQAPAEVEDWLVCGKERVGTGELAVELKIADAVEA